MPKPRTRDSGKPPVGYRVTPYAIKDDPNLKGWLNFRIWKGQDLVLDGAQTAFETPDEARRVGISYAWDIHEKKTQWT